VRGVSSLVLFAGSPGGIAFGAGGVLIGLSLGPEPSARRGRGCRRL